MFEVILTTLTPVHVGVSQEHWWQKGVDFFQDGEYIYVVKLDDIFKRLGKADPADIDRLTSAMSHGASALNDFSDYLVRQRNVDLKEVAFRRFRFQDNRMKELRPMMSSGVDRTPMIPSSSIKGVIRTAFLNAQIEGNPFYVTQSRNLGKESRRGFKFSDKGLQNNYISRDPKEDPFRFVRFSDFYFEKTECVKSQILNLHNEVDWGYKRGQFTHLECLKAGQSSNGKLSVPEKVIREVKKRTNKIRGLDNIQANKLCAMANDLTSRLIEKEVKFWKEEPEVSDVAANYASYLPELKEQVESCQKGECVIRIGGGSGWDFMTGGWTKLQNTLSGTDWDKLKDSLRRKDYDDTIPYPKTRKLTHENMPMGFVKMKVS